MYEREQDIVVLTDNVEQNPFEVATGSVQEHLDQQNELSLQEMSGQEDKADEVIISKQGKMLVNKGTLVQSHELLSL